MDLVLLVREAETAASATATSTCGYPRPTARGGLTAMVWDDVARVAALATPASRCTSSAATPCMPATDRSSTCARVRQAEPGTYRLDELLDGPAHDGCSRWRRSCASCSRRSRIPTCARLLERVFGEASDVWRAYRVAPAAKYYHQAYRHGLLEHSLTVAPGGQRDLGDLPRDRPRRGRHRVRCCTTSASSRPTRSRDSDRPLRRRAPPGRDTPWLLPGPARDREA